MARAIEAALDLPQGWMDREHNEPKAPVDEREKLFIETALILFRAQPDDATRLMLDLLRRQLLTPGALAQHAALGANP
jgi:hypothetical protein